MSQRALDFIDSTTTEIKNALDTFPHGEVCVRLRRAGNIGNGVKYSWPGNTVNEALRFARVLAILSEIRTAIEENVIVTKRDIFYHFPELFGKQDVVDQYIDDIALTCGISRADLHVTASPKGLVCGIVKHGLRAGSTTKNECIHLIPTDLATVTVSALGSIKWVLLVEKEATFKTLVEARFDQCCKNGLGILVTAKGYPDLNTLLFIRHVVQLLRHRQPGFRVFSVTDADPDGIEIHRCFTTLPTAYAEHSEILDVTWLGVDPLPLLYRNDISADSILPLKKRDRTRARGMLQRLSDERLKQCVRTMMMLNIKLEMQAIDNVAGSKGLVVWLQEQIDNAEHGL